MAPVLPSSSLPESSEQFPLQIPNNNEEISLDGDILHLDKLPEGVQELCIASLKVSLNVMIFKVSIG